MRRDCRPFAGLLEEQKRRIASPLFSWSPSPASFLVTPCGGSILFVVHYLVHVFTRRNLGMKTLIDDIGAEELNGI